MPSAFVPLVLLAETFGLVALGLIITWMAKFHGGFALDKTGQEFSLHPVFMTLGFLFLNANALMTYRILGNTFSHFSVKIIHFTFQLLGLICASFGLACVFQFHNAQGYANVYSLHSWVGITTYGFFCLQFLFGLCTFLILGTLRPTSTMALRKAYLRLHVFAGVMILVMAGATALLGMTETISFNILNYPSLPTAGVIANVFGLFVVGFVALVCYILFNDDFKAVASRSNTHYEEHISIDN